MTLVPYSPPRVIGVTIGLSAAGAAFGGFAGAASLAIGLALSDGLELLAEPSIYLFGGGIGAALGAVCAPLAGWLLLRRVPLGRAFGGLTIGTVIGGVLGWLTLGTLDPLVLPIAAGALGFLAAAIWLRLTHALRGTSHDGTGAA